MTRTRALAAMTLSLGGCIAVPVDAPYACEPGYRYYDEPGYRYDYDPYPCHGYGRCSQIGSNERHRRTK